MDVFDEELLRFWKIANQLNLQYIMIGGVATNLHGYQRTTEDINLWIKDTQQNKVILKDVFREYGMGDFKTLPDMQFIPGWTYFHLDNGLRLDIMTSVKGLDNSNFDSLLISASIATIYGVEIPFLHLNALIITKKAANRPKDQLDLIELERIKKIIEEEGSKQ
ncbi:MAG: nucleotidyltransferase [Daejeonella sp.]|uniref:nucleotidyltransferase n=1 Tax=Daejeonella sp. TaxID=2805397 RepID=UPI002737084C|nr:nucleotidyltransferase [Daejeonella sp.]MDP3468251.1 nucleotidyltransferase [Daejeonella sp.]